MPEKTAAIVHVSPLQNKCLFTDFEHFVLAYLVGVHISVVGKYTIRITGTSTIKIGEIELIARKSMMASVSGSVRTNKASVMTTPKTKSRTVCMPR